MYIVGEYKMYFHSLWCRPERLTRGLLFLLFLKLLQIDFILPTMYAYCLFISRIWL